jgi:hypothetical protein
MAGFSGMAAWRLVLAALLLAGATPVAAQSGDEPAGDRWLIRVAPYLWATSLDGKATVAGIKSDVDVGFDDIVQDLALGGMLLADVQKGRFGVAVNGVFARVTPKNDVNGVRVKTTSDTLQLGVAPYYRLVDWTYRTTDSGKPLQLRVSPLAGFRVTHLRLEVNVRNGGPSADEDETWVDPIIGSRFGIDLTERWNVVAEADVGGFGVGSDIAWNAQAFLGYRTSVFGVPTTLAAGYRALHQDYDHNNFKWDVTMHGPAIGASFAF